MEGTVFGLTLSAVAAEPDFAPSFNTSNGNNLVRKAPLVDFIENWGPAQQEDFLTLKTAKRATLHLNAQFFAQNFV